MPTSKVKNLLSITVLIGMGAIAGFMVRHDNISVTGSPVFDGLNADTNGSMCTAPALKIPVSSARDRSLGSTFSR